MRHLWSDVMNLDVSALRRELERSAKRFGDVTIAELVAPEADASNGLYVFFHGDAVAYVGRCGSRALIERLPSHLDSREGGWFGTLLERIARAAGGDTKRHEVVADALDVRVAVIFKNVTDGSLSYAETALRHVFKPKYNTPKKPKALTGTLASFAATPVAATTKSQARGRQARAARR